MKSLVEADKRIKEINEEMKLEIFKMLQNYTDESFITSLNEWCHMISNTNYLNSSFG